MCAGSIFCASLECNAWRLSAPYIYYSLHQVWPILNEIPYLSHPTPPESYKGSISMISHLLLSIIIISQPPMGSTEPKRSAEQIANLESKHLKNIQQLTFDFARAGEGYFSPDGKQIIFQAAPVGKSDYQIFTQSLEAGAKPKMVSTGKGKCTCLFSPEWQVHFVWEQPSRPRSDEW